MALVSSDARRAPLFPAFIHYKTGDEAVSVRRRSSSFSGYIPHALNEFADDLARCRKFGQLASARTPSSENDGACEAHPGKIDVEQNPVDSPQSRRRSKQAVGVPTVVCDTDKSHCGQGAVHADTQAEDLFDRNMNLVKGSHVTFPTSPVPALLLSQRITSNNMEGYKKPIDDKKLTSGNQNSIHTHQECRGATSQEIKTLMIRNLPPGLTQKALLQELDRSGFQDQYDLAYLPHNFAMNINLGFAFVNFTTASAAQSLIDQWHRGSRQFAQNVYAEDLNLTPASLQGADSNLKQWFGSRGKRIRNPKFRPYVAAQHAEKVQAIFEGRERGNK